MENKDFQFFLSSKGPVAVVSLVGRVAGKNTMALQALAVEATSHAQTVMVVLNMRDVSDMTSDVFAAFAQMQKQIRELPAELRLCGLRPELREKLTARGVVRALEIFDNLHSAIQQPLRTQKHAG